MIGLKETYDLLFWMKEMLVFMFRELRQRLIDVREGVIGQRCTRQIWLSTFLDRLRSGGANVLDIHDTPQP